MKAIVSGILALLLVGTSAFGQNIVTIQSPCRLTVVNKSLDDFTLNENVIVQSGDRMTIPTNCPRNVLGAGALLANTGYRAQISAGVQEIVITVTGKNTAQCADINKSSCFNLLGSNQICAACVNS